LDGNYVGEEMMPDNIGDGGERGEGIETELNGW
jgi:hypothetical protein